MRKELIKEMAEDQTARILSLDNLQDMVMQGIALSDYLSHLYEEYDIKVNELWKDGEFDNNVETLVKKIEEDKA